MILEEITMEEFTKLLDITKTIIFPFGTVEEHGTHLPLNTDTLIIRGILERVIDKRKVFLAPPVHYGVCTTTGPHPGTVAISAETLRRLTADLIKDSYGKGLRNFLLISGHGGSLHMSAMKEVSEILINELEAIRIAVFSPYDVLWKQFSQLVETENDSHAGELETSMVLALSPELVKGRAEEEYPTLPKPFIVKDKMKYWPGGVWGNPGKATKEKGEEAIRLSVEKIVEYIDRIESGEM